VKDSGNGVVARVSLGELAVGEECLESHTGPDEKAIAQFPVDFRAPPSPR
jgi:hypothetical protein